MLEDKTVLNSAWMGSGLISVANCFMQAPYVKLCELLSSRFYLNTLLFFSNVLMISGWNFVQ